MTSITCDGNQYNRVSALLKGFSEQRSHNANLKWSTPQSNSDFVNDFLSNTNKDIHKAKQSTYNSDPLNVLIELEDGSFAMKNEHKLPESIILNPESSLQPYIDRAKEGCIESCYYVAQCLFYGNECIKTHNTAFQWYLKCTLLDGNKVSNAEYMIGYCISNGLGIPKHENEAFRWYLKSAKKNYAKAQYAMGRCYKYGFGTHIDKKLALEYYVKSAQQHDRQAEYAIGDCYYYGTIVKKNKDDALKWFKKSANQGDKQAQYMLGWILYSDLDYENTLPYFVKSAQQHHGLAQRDLGSCFYYGQGVDEDKEMAYSWFKKSTGRNAFANVIVAYMEYHGIGTLVNKKYNEKSIKNWLSKYNICNKDNIPALFADMKYFDSVYMQAIQQCNHIDPYIASIVSSLYKRGQGTIKDDEQSKLWHNRALEEIWMNSKL